MRKLDSIFLRARREAFPLVADRLRAALPKGWTVVLAVGWGISVLDDAGSLVEDDATPARLRRALETAAQFERLFGVENERISA